VADLEGATSERNIGDSVAFDIVKMSLEVVQHMGDI